MESADLWGRSKDVVARAGAAGWKLVNPHLLSHCLLIIPSGLQEHTLTHRLPASAFIYAKSDKNLYVQLLSELH